MMQRSTRIIAIVCTLLVVGAVASVYPLYRHFSRPHGGPPVTVTDPADETDDTDEPGDPNQASFTVTFNGNGGTNIASQIIEANGRVLTPSMPIRPGHVFYKWYFLGQVYDFDLPVTRNITLVAKWYAYTASDNQMITINANWAHNKSQAMVVDSEGFIFDQHYYTTWKYDGGFLTSNGCGIIAIYNSLLKLGKYMALADLIRYFEATEGSTLKNFDLLGDIVGIVSGSMGTWPPHILKFNNDFVFANSVSQVSQSNLQSIANGMATNQAIVLTFWNGTFPLQMNKGMHTVCVIKNANGTLSVINDSRRPATFTTISTAWQGGTFYEAYILR
ncbi:MAG: InlB B-repeat-containing protein [Christensenellaceae bacterium]|jgi:hypothetical protein|nr:InlB B-repeat-containing protein [Christensenellaceae bacterium]